MLQKKDFHPTFNEWFRQAIIDWAKERGWPLDISYVAGYTGGTPEIEKIIASVESGQPADLIMHNLGIVQLRQARALEAVSPIVDEIEAKWGKIDFLVHAIGYSDKSQLRGRYGDTTRDNFNMTMDISVFSFTAVCQRAEKMMPNGGSLLTLTYYGAEKVMPHYNVMGVAKASLEANVRYLAAALGPEGTRVNAVSAGPIRTLAASGISGMRELLRLIDFKSPLGRNVTQDDVARTALYLASSLSSAVNGEVIYVDSGYNILGV